MRWWPKFQMWALINGCLNSTLLTNTRAHNCMRFCTSTVFLYENGKEKKLSYESTFHEKSKECRCEQARYYFLNLWSKLTSHILEHHTFTNRSTISVWLLGRHSNLYEIYVLFTKDKGLSVFFSRVKSIKKMFNHFPPMFPWNR